jgi:hypothetical protein
MNFGWHDLFGTIGVGMVLVAYFLLQIGRMKAEDVRYSLLNGVGAALVVASLLFEFNLSAFLMEAFWVLISLIGIWRWWRARLSSES